MAQPRMSAVRAVAALALSLAVAAPLAAQPVRLAHGPRTVRHNGPDFIDLNSASRDQLASIRGIGQIYADKIVAGRPYKVRSELVQRDIIPASLYIRIKHQLMAVAPEAGAPAPEPVAAIAGRIDLNNASRDQLAELKGIGQLYADKIVAGRPYKAEIELVGRRVISLAVFERIKDRVTAVQP